MEVTITNDNFESYKNGELPLVVDLWATWCGPCRQIAPIVSELANEYDGKLVVGKCDVEENVFAISLLSCSSKVVSWLTSLWVQLLRLPFRRSSILSCNT